MNIIGQIVFQGDVGLVEIDAIPASATPVDAEGGAYILAHSETGHNHVVEARPDVKLYQDASDPLSAYLHVLSIDTLIQHQRSFDTHAAITIKPGKYLVRRQREYAAEGWRRAQD